MDKEGITMIDEIAKFINYVGEAGINDVYEVKISNIKDISRIKYDIEMKSNTEENELYLYTYGIDIFSSDNKDLHIGVKVKKGDEESRFIPYTEIVISYLFPNNKIYKLKGKLNGHNYGDLLNIKGEDLKNVLIVESDEKRDLISTIPRKCEKYLFSVPELEALLKKFSEAIEIETDKNMEDKKIVDEAINNLNETLTEKQIKLLKQTL